MGITISGENNSDRILASDGVIDQLSGFNVVGVITATSFTGNLTGDVTGNLTGNVNQTSNLLLQIGGSEKFRVGSSGQLGIGGANYGTSGQVLQSAGSGAPPTWNTISGTTINSNTNNYLITGTGTANTLQGESNLTFDGSTLTADGDVLFKSTTSGREVLWDKSLNRMIHRTNSRASFGSSSQLEIWHNGSSIGYIEQVADGYLRINGNDGLHLYTKPSGGSATERLRITSGGEFLVGATSSTGARAIIQQNSSDTNPLDQATCADSSGMRLQNYSFGVGRHTALSMECANSSTVQSASIIAQSVSSGQSPDIIIATRTSNSANTERLRISSDGNMGLGLTPAYSGLFGGAQRTFHIGGTAAPCLRITSSSSGQADLVVHAGNSGRRADIANLATNGSISIWTKPSSGSIAERIKISSAGYVTKPAHPSFCARHDTGDGFSGDIFVLTRVENNYRSWNTGGHYSTSTGKFTAPVDGVYYFEAQAMTTGHSNGDNIQDLIQLRSNNGLISHPRQRKSYFTTTNDANGYFTNSCAGQTKLSSGDTVWIQANRSFGVLNTNYSYFTGWLIG